MAAVNYNPNIFRYSVTITKSQLNSMISAQEKGVQYVKDNESNASSIAATLVGFGATILGLIFLKSTATAVGTGIASLVASVGGTMKNSIVSLAENGETELLKIYRAMNNLGATSVNIDIGYVQIYEQATLKEIIRFVQGTAVNYYTLSNGTKLMQ